MHISIRQAIRFWHIKHAFGVLWSIFSFDLWSICICQIIHVHHSKSWSICLYDNLWWIWHMFDSNILRRQSRRIYYDFFFFFSRWSKNLAYRSKEPGSKVSKQVGTLVRNSGILFAFPFVYILHPALVKMSRHEVSGVDIVSKWQAGRKPGVRIWLLRKHRSGSLTCKLIILGKKYFFPVTGSVKIRGTDQFEKMRIRILK